MAPSDQKTEIVTPAELPEDLPLPSDPKVIFLGGLFVLALLAAAYVVSEIVLPLVFAIVLKLLLQPALRVLERLHVPRILAALLLILALFGMIVGLGTAISGPARTWAAKLPEGIPNSAKISSSAASIRGTCNRSNTRKAGCSRSLRTIAKPNVKRHKSDAVDAEAICEAVTKANKRFGQ